MMHRWHLTSGGVARDWTTFLATGPEENLMAWQWRVMGWVELFDRRGQTVRCRVHGIDFMDLANPDWGAKPDPERVKKQLDDAVEYARTDDVTVQLLEEAADAAAYPVLHLGTHGMKWPPEMKPGQIECEECGTIFDPLTDSYECPGCGFENYPEDDED
jgi:hypothetical protein